MTQPLVTIVTPSYNQAAYLEETLESVLAQDYPNIEYIVVDDGSTDGSVDIIRRYEERLSWWTSQPNAGQVAALNAGFRRARGELLGWINSDDTLLPGAVSAVVQEFERDPELLIVYGDNEVMDEHSVVTGYLPAREFDVVAMLRTAQNHVPQPGSLFARRALEIAPLNEAGYYYFDFEFVVQLGACGRGRRIERPLGGYRLHEVSKSVSAPRRKADDALRMIDAVYRTPALPPHIVAVEGPARAAAELTAAEYLYAAGDGARARRALAAALRHDPTRARGAIPLALRTLLPSNVAAGLRALRRRAGSRAPSAPS